MADDPFGRAAAQRIEYAVMPTTGNISVPLSRSWRCAAGDTITIKAQASTTGCSVYGAATAYTVLDITQIAP